TSLKIAAVAFAAACGLVYFTFLPSTEKTAFADAAERLRDAQTLAYRMTMDAPDLKIRTTTRCLIKSTGVFRTEVEGGVVTIIDGKQGKQLILNPTAKTALLLEGKGTEPGAAHNIADRLRQLTERDAKPLGEKAIGAIRALGYLVKHLGMEMTVWVDPGTRL